MTRPLLLSCVVLALLAHPLRAAPRKGSWIETLSWKPRAFLYHGFLSDAEADHIVALAKPSIKRSSTVNFDGTFNETDEIRTSYGMFLNPHHDGIVADIEERIARWSKLPVHHAEAIQVLRYELGQTYQAHWDELDPTDAPHTVGGGSPRVATVLMYLTDVEEGGETAFPHSVWLDKEVQTAGKRYSNCTNGGVAVHARKGDALLFWGLKVDVAHLDLFSLHAGCPVLKGVKWSATSWIHTDTFYPETAEQAQQKVQAQQEVQEQPTRPCRDEAAECTLWAAKGECERNPRFMMEGDNARCRKTCGECCPAGDVLCERATQGRRRQAGQQRL